MSFTSLINNVSKEKSTLNIPADWGQGRAAFGGLVAGLVYESMRHQVTNNAPVRSLQISFVGPVSSENFDIESEILRQGKSVTQVMGRGLQDGETKVVVMGSFGGGRESLISVEGERKLFSEDPHTIEPMPYIPGVIPEFTKHFDFRYATGMPFSGFDGDSLRGFVRFRDEAEIGIAQFLGLVDAWPPAVLPRLKTPAPASSLNWNIELVQPMPSLAADEFCRYQADIMYAGDGYACTRARIWNAAGELLATSQQTVVAFA